MHRWHNIEFPLSTWVIIFGRMLHDAPKVETIIPCEFLNLNYVYHFLYRILKMQHKQITNKMVDHWWLDLPENKCRADFEPKLWYEFVGEIRDILLIW